MEIVPHVFKMAHIDIIMVTCINTKLMQFSYIRFKMAANGPICIPFHIMVKINHLLIHCFCHKYHCHIGYIVLNGLLEFNVSLSQ